MRIQIEVKDNTWHRTSTDAGKPTRAAVRTRLWTRQPLPLPPAQLISCCYTLLARRHVSWCIADRHLHVSRISLKPRLIHTILRVAL